jgi:hypothetical protein
MDAARGFPHSKDWHSSPAQKRQAFAEAASRFPGRRFFWPHADAGASRENFLATASVAAIGTVLKRGDGVAGTAKAIASAPTGAVENAARTAATIIFSAAHGMNVGDVVLLAGIANTLFNGLFPIHTVPNGTTITVPNLAPVANATSGGGTGTVQDGSYVTVVEALEINGPEDALEILDVTNMDSPSFFQELIPTIIKAGILACEFNYIAQSTSQKNVLADYANRALRTWHLQFSDASPTVAAFQAYVVKWHPIAKVKDQLKVQIELQISGAVDFAP